MSITCHLSHRHVLRISGEDRRNFLQGLVSNDIALCQPKQPIYAALLTPQGKFLHDLFVHDFGDAFLIDCEAERATDLLQRLTTYKLRAKVSIENVGNHFEVWAGVGTLDPRLSELGLRGIFEKGKVSGSSRASAYDRHRLELGVPEGSRDLIVGKSTLSDGNIDLLNGISWTKGCYVGQELTARIYHRALVKKRMFPVRIECPAPEAGTILNFRGTEIGEMRSSNGDLGLAVLNIEQAREAVAAGEALTSGNTKLAPYQPSWLKL